MFLSRRPDRIDWLKKVPLFSGLSGRDLDLIVRQTDVVKADAGKVLTRQGALGEEFLLIVDGSARVERDAKPIARLDAGDFFGEMSLIDGKPRSASVIAETPITLLAVEEMRELVQRLEQTEAPHTCPHGRPTTVHLSGSWLAQTFRRRG